MKNFINKEINQKLGLAIVVIVFLIAVLAIFGCSSRFSLEPLLSLKLPKISLPRLSLPLPSIPGRLKDIKKFSSEAEFKEYLKKGASAASYYGLGGGGLGLQMMGIKGAVPTPTPAPRAEEKEPGYIAPERVSGTTVQVAGIDEPDIVKTDGREIYFSKEGYRGPWPLIETEPRTPGTSLEEQQKIMPPELQATTKNIRAFPPADLAVDSEIGKTGNLLLNKNILVIFSGREIGGYNVSSPKSPSKKWEIKLEDNSYLVDSRLYNDKIYLVVRNNINEWRPCPVKPLTIGVTAVEIKCAEIYHPVLPIPIDATFILMVLDPGSGQVIKRVSFVGSSGSSVVYMSAKAIYVTYPYYESAIKFFSNFLEEKGRDLIPLTVIEKIKKLAGYDISEQAKMVELEFIWQKYVNSLSDDDRLKIENEFSNRMADYNKEHQRELEKTGLVKIGLSDFDVSASGNVPGQPLNQFSLDEYNGNLRIAVTIAGRWWGMWGGSGGESSNDVYVLDKDLKILGQVRDMGLGERIYSVRFIEDKGYLVTFRETDPFYVLDLRNPEKPALKGELKIPGYSGYLHPISKDKILGIGKVDSQVKISLFDVSRPEEPLEKDKYVLDEYWSDVLSTHHAFLLDTKHEIFFMPGGKGGYIFSYKNDKLGLTKAVSGISSRRALYLNDYLYIVGDNKISVLNETDWEKVNELSW